MDKNHKIDKELDDYGAFRSRWNDDGSFDMEFTPPINIDVYEIPDDLELKVDTTPLFEKGKP